MTPDDAKQERRKRLTIYYYNILVYTIYTVSDKKRGNRKEKKPYLPVNIDYLPNLVETTSAVNFCDFILQVDIIGTKPSNAHPSVKAIPNDVKAVIVTDRAAGSSALVLATKYKVGC